MLGEFIASLLYGAVGSLNSFLMFKLPDKTIWTILRVTLTIHTSKLPTLSNQGASFTLPS